MISLYSSYGRLPTDFDLIDPTSILDIVKYNESEIWMQGKKSWNWLRLKKRKDGGPIDISHLQSVDKSSRNESDFIMGVASYFFYHSSEFLYYVNVDLDR